MLLGEGCEYMNILFDWCAEDGIHKMIEIIKLILQIIRYVVPIGLIVMTTMDIFKKVINPDDKDGQQKILVRTIAAIVLFFVPVLVDFAINLAKVGGADTEINLGSCWESIK